MKKTLYRIETEIIPLCISNVELFESPDLAIARYDELLTAIEENNLATNVEVTFSMIERDVL